MTHSRITFDPPRWHARKLIAAASVVALSALAVVVLRPAERPAALPIKHSPSAAQAEAALPPAGAKAASGVLDRPPGQRRSQASADASTGAMNPAVQRSPLTSTPASIAASHVGDPSVARSTVDRRGTVPRFDEVGGLD